MGRTWFTMIEKELISEPPVPPRNMPFLSNSQKRLSTETREQYRKRIALVRRIEKGWLDGRLVWKSKEVISRRGEKFSAIGRTLINGLQ